MGGLTCPTPHGRDPSQTLPTPLRVLAEWNPVSAITQAAREQFGNIHPGTPDRTAWSLQNPVTYTLIWVLLNHHHLRPDRDPSLPDDDPLDGLAGPGYGILQILLLRLIPGQRQGPPVGLFGLLVPVETGEQLAPGGMEQVVAIQRQ